MAAEREDTLVRGLLAGVATFRWLAWVWMVVVLVLGTPEFGIDRTRPWVAYLGAGVALAVTTAGTLLLRRDARLPLRLAVIATEVTVGFGLGIADKFAYNGVSHSQWLASTWPLAGILTAGIAFGGRGGMVAGIVVGLGRMDSDYLDPSLFGDNDHNLVSGVTTLVLYALTGGMAGYVTRRLREAERRISVAQAREEIARTLHDGVLQTLAMVQRRASDPDLARIAHDQERELREYLFGSPTSVSGGGEVGARLRSAAARFEDHYEASARVVLAPDMPNLSPAAADAMVGAVTEALTNAGKHGQAQLVTVYAEPVDHSIFCSVKDDGSGFDVASVPEGVGLERSIRGRITEAGGRVEIDARPGRGTEVRCWLPL